jgi:hypothetical protein
MSALGHKQTYAAQKGHVRFAPESDIKRGIVKCPLWANSVPDINADEKSRDISRGLF